ncbi:MAG TPA: flagellar hook-length control protein FliK [Methylophilaceae bacterium]|nr:flagellar hook-length control protein FliK [Methylophilaceae bacterium]
MQNLSLQVAQPAPVKGISDASNKNDTNADKSATEPNNSFQMLLSRQVLAKQVQDNVDKQTASNQALAKQASASQAPSKQTVAEHVATQEKSKAAPATGEADASKAKKADVQKTDADVANAGLVPGVQAELDAKGLPVKKEDADSKSEDAGITAVDASAMAAIPVISAPIINATPLVTTAGSASTTDAQLASGGGSTSQKQQSLDTVLSNALSQGKGANGMEKGGVDKDVVEASGGKTASDHARWLDVMLPNAAKQTISDDSATAKLMLNAINESAAKDAITPTASYQPVAQASATQVNAAQQLGSSNLINAYPGKTGWDQAISQKVMWMVGAGEQTASLTLNPPDMGPLQVVISVNNDKADTTFISDNPEVRKALEDGMANLRDKMNESGIQLGQANVSSGGQAQQQFEQAQQNRMAATQSNNGTAPQPEKTGNTNPVVRVSNGLVDTFA